MALISVIMPVYKVEAFVGKTIESVLNQTLTDIEFFAVDDGSPDKSGEICDQYAAKDSRLTVIHQKNQGAPMARNAALELAKGKYVYFIDSDDWIEANMLENMYRLAETNHADLVVTGFKMEYYQDGQDVTYHTPCPDRVYSSIEEFRMDAHNYLNNSLLSLPWNKLFLMEHIQRNNIRFQNTKWDDHHFCMDYLMDCRNVVLSSAEDYHWYRSRQGSETMINYADTKMFEKRKEHYLHIVKLYEHWGNLDQERMGFISSYYAGRLFQCVQEMVDNKKVSAADKRKKIQEIVQDPLTRETMKNATQLSGKMKILCLPMKMHSVYLSMAAGYAVSLVRTAAPGLFIKMKEKEVHGA